MFAAYNINEDDPDVIVVTADDLSQLETSTLSAQARSRIVSAVRSGKVVVAPKHMVTLNGEQTVGWWEKDPTTGDVSGVMEDGLHFAAVEYAFLLNWNPVAWAVVGFSHGVAEYSLKAVVKLLDAANSGASADRPAAAASVTAGR